jgi:cytochrome P450
MTADIVVEQSDVPYLDFTDPRFSIRSQIVRDARAASWYARTPYGLAVLRYEDMQKLLLHPNLRQGSYQWPEHNKVTGQFADWWIRILLNQVGTDHARLRRLAMPAFSQKLIASLQPKFIAIANELIASFAPKGRCEFMSEFSEPYATRVICDLLVLPHSEWKRIAELVTVMGLALGVTYKQDLERIEAATEGLFGYARDLIDERRRQPGEDFISVLVTTNSDKDALSDQELEDMVVLSIFGGIDTTRNQIGLAMDQFITHPDQWKLLGERPELARPAVEEVMRTRPTTTWVTRSAMEDFTYKDLDIKAGTTLHLLAESAGTDPDAFEPGFDITAKRKQHFGFGAGMHHCLGHFIARGDMTEALKLLAQRIKNPRYDGEQKWLPDSGNTGPVVLPIAFDPEG